MQHEGAVMIAARQRSRGRAWMLGKRVSKKLIIYLLLTIVGLIALVPFLWMVSTSLKTVLEASTYPPPILPAEPQWHDFSDVFNS
ncbi:MAG: hypothetical protein ACRDIE_17270, partial [Chloroflexota bacterium]